MKNTFFAALAATALLTTPAMAADIEGNWRTASGETAKIAKCGGSFCINLTTGKYKGKQIGKVSGSGPYTGTVTDPADDKQYSGKATISGSTMKMRGCALKVFCKTQTWKKL
ncbi:DUF2147 domain-containing protein [Ahrensia sp. 13_GOM-1096m]|uniref:DUF2147 domain-containing protein n=1 Tax=Ahrensia sp. 13_GOM-1096m TaxID=1380380 RepID=UPI00047C1F69|nr:DUF2147 domain-containing protein [Ahrensia sp. 13_GOM-1096m]